MPVFETVAAEYDAARPRHPAGVYDALGDLVGSVVLDVGAGTGIATRELLRRGAWVVAIEPGSVVLGRAAAHTPGLRALEADGAHLPVRDGIVDLLCFAQAWHWLDPGRRTAEAHRVLRDGGRWAGWWSHARADDSAWFDEYWTILEQTCPGTHRGQRDTDWGATVAEDGLFDVGERITVPWVRELTVDGWLTDQVSHSYVAALPSDERDRLIQRLRALLERHHPDHHLTVPYETWLWIATKA